EADPTAPAEPSVSEAEPTAPAEPSVSEADPAAPAEPSLSEVDSTAPAERAAGLMPGRELRSLDTPAMPGERPPAPEPLPAASESQPVTAAERARIRDEVLDWLNRSRDLASRPSAAWSRGGREYRAELTRVPASGATGIEEA